MRALALMSGLVATSEAIRRDWSTSNPHVGSAAQQISNLLKESSADKSITQFLGPVLEQLHSVSEATPGVMDSLRGTMGKVIQDIESGTDTKVQQGHEQDQNEINAGLSGLERATNAAVQQKSDADSADQVWSACVQGEVSKLNNWEQEEGKLSNARNAAVQPCQEVEAITNISYDPSSSFSFDCDMSQGGSCDAKMKEFDAYLDNLVNATEASTNSAVNVFNTTKDACTSATENVASHERAVAESKQKYVSQRGGCTGKFNTRSQKICSFGQALKSKCESASSYKNLAAGMDQKQADRVKEWQTSSVTKCLLGHLKDSVPLNHARLEQCIGAVKYGQHVGSIDTRMDGYGNLMSPAKFNCQEQTFTWNSWQIPTGDLARTSDYKKEQEISVIDWASGAQPFDFCMSRR